MTRISAGSSRPRKQAYTSQIQLTAFLFPFANSDVTDEPQNFRGSL